MAVNYILTPTNLNGVTVGETFGSNFDCPGPYQLAAIIQPIDQSQYYVSYEMFNISGGTPSPLTEPAGNLNCFDGTGYESVVDKNVFEQGDADTNLPSYVLEVELFNYQDYVVIRATIDPNWIVPANLTGMFTTILDIDGDAQLITGTTSSQQFNISVQLDDDSNCTVVPFLSPTQTIQNYAMPSLYIFEITQTGTTTGTVVASPGSATIESSPLYIPNLGFNYMFYIVPNNGYTISRHNLSIATYGSTYGTIYYNGGYWETDSNAAYGTISGNCGTCPYPQSSGSYNFDGFKQAQVEIGGQNYNYSEVYDYITSVEASDVRLVDTLGPYPNNPIPSFGYEFVNGVTPDNYCPSDWTGNAVLVQLVAFSNIIPGSNPQDVVFRINGSAMFDDGSQCGEFNFDLEEQ